MTTIDWLGPEGDEMNVAFTRVFGRRPKKFGSAALKLGGYSDDNDGVQWNVAYDPRDETRWVGVNLEGMQYDDWPVARLIEGELRDPSLLDVVKGKKSLAPVVLVWHRDYWQAASRPPIEEQAIEPTPIALGELTPADWRKSLEGARDCLNPRRKRRGRAVQTVTLADGDEVEGEVSPHLMFRYMADGAVDWKKFMKEAKSKLQPLHDWTSRRAKKPVQF